MTRFMQTASRGALIALIAAAPVAGFAQSADNGGGTLIPEQPADSASADVDANTQTDATTNMAETEDAGSDEQMDMQAAADELNDSDLDKAADRVNNGYNTETATDEGDEAGDPMMTADSEDMPAAGMASDDQTDMAQAEDAKPVEGQITMQDSNTMLAEDLLGAAVYNSADENVGDINDLIIGLDGSVKGVVIGVGGFLGLGEKQVALQMAALDVVDEEDGMPRLMTSATKADLESAPEFVAADDQETMQQMDTMEDNTGPVGGEGQQPVD
ncbi:PRC-barrel domain-containing protein [Pseudooceanicola sp. MF1-13]|uniref:PRC-barrel domain-containing protein n=1 Tax=Pseudooceanicola sp. MF1-13 TaxID=3379095 RepID=UPI003891E433